MANDNERGQFGTASVFRFRIVHLLYVTALFASALATFGSNGILPAIVLSVAWALVFAGSSRPVALLIVLSMLIPTCCLGWPAINAAPGAARRMQCSNNLKQIALALHNYHDVFKTFPPAYIADENGRPMHSWRVLILPFIEQQPLYEAYRFDEPWDGPNNRKLQTPMPPVFACPSQQQLNSKAQTHTSYVAVVGENTVWPEQRPMRFKEIVDGTVNTLLVCEIADRRISWMEPTDIGYADAIELLTSRDPHQHSGHIHRSFFYEWSAGRQVAIADGSVRFLEQGIEADDARRLLIVNDGEPLDVDKIRGADLDTRRLRIDNCFRLGVFVLLALWPLPWVWINPHGTRAPVQSDKANAAGKP